MHGSGRRCTDAGFGCTLGQLAMKPPGRWQCPGSRMSVHLLLLKFADLTLAVHPRIRSTLTRAGGFPSLPAASQIRGVHGRGCPAAGGCHPRSHPRTSGRQMHGCEPGRRSYAEPYLRRCGQFGRSVVPSIRRSTEQNPSPHGSAKIPPPCDLKPPMVIDRELQSHAWKSFLPGDRRTNCQRR